MEFDAALKQLSRNIILTKRFHLLPQYFNSFNQTQSTGLNSELTEYFFFSLSYIYKQICLGKGKLLMGFDKKIPLWVEGSAVLFDLNKADQINNHYHWSILTALALITMPLLTGQGNQAEFDRLLIPSPDRFHFSPPNRWELKNFDSRLSLALGYSAGGLEIDEVEKIIAKALLERTYQLVTNRPVLVKMEQNPLVKQVILIQKGDLLLARVETYRFGDLIHFLNLFKTERPGGMFDTLVVKSGLLPGELNALSGLLAVIYHDLVMAERVEAREIYGVRSKGKKSSVSPQKGELEELQPKTNTIAWQYIPRCLYTRQNVGVEMVVERVPVTEEERKQQQAVRKWHMVCGHIRRYRHKPDFIASDN